jgi:Outer membrane protein beta-barrel domain
MTPRHSPFHPPRFAWIAPLALALAFGPAAASAQAAPHKTAVPAAKTQAPKAAPAQRTPAAIQAATADYALVGRLEYAGGLGLAIPFESGVNAGFKVAGGAFYGLQTLKPGLVLQVGGTVGWTYNGYPSPIDGSLNTFEVLPTARLRLAVQPRLFVYGDGGLGLAFVHSRSTMPGFPAIPPFPAIPSTTVSNTDAALLLKLGGGIGYDIQPNLSLTFEPAFNIYMKSGSMTQFTMLVGALYRP